MQSIAGTIMLIDGWRRALIAFFAGAIATFALAPYHFPLVGFISFPVLVWLIDGAAGEPGRGALRRLGPAFRIGWCFGFGYFVGGLWWLGAAVLVEAEAFWWALPFAVLGLPAVLALYYAAAVALARAFWSEGAGRIFALAASLAGFEYLRGVLFTGFPWNEIGMMAVGSPVLMQSLSLVGLHGLTLAAVLVFSSPAIFVGAAGARAATFALCAALVVGHVGFGAWRLSQEGPGFVEDVRLRIVQPNILQSQKWDAEEAERIFSRLLALSAEGRDASESETLIVWPESSVPFILTESPAGIARIAEMMQLGETLLAGAARVEQADRPADALYYNSVLVVADDGAIVDARDKRHLVPFGEYLPFQEELESLGIEQLTRLPGGFTAGTHAAPVMVAGTSFLSLVCYEIIFQNEIDLSGGRPDFLLNVTNDAWYGHTPGPHQHLAHSQASAVAFGLPLVRAANTGISVVADSKGVVLAGLGLGEGGIVPAALPRPTGETVFSRTGNIPFFSGLAMAALVGGLAASRSHRFG